MVKTGLAGVKNARDRIGGAAWNQGKVGRKRSPSSRRGPAPALGMGDLTRPVGTGDRVATQRLDFA